jgi:hypothetical protein
LIGAKDTKSILASIFFSFIALLFSSSLLSKEPARSGKGFPEYGSRRHTLLGLFLFAFAFSCLSS